MSLVGINVLGCVRVEMGTFILFYFYKRSERFTAGKKRKKDRKKAFKLEMAK